MEFFIRPRQDFTLSRIAESLCIMTEHEFVIRRR